MEITEKNNGYFLGYNDNETAVIGNFFNGQIGRFIIDTGEITATAETNVERSLAGIAEFN